MLLNFSVTIFPAFCSLKNILQSLNLICGAKECRTWKQKGTIRLGECVSLVVGPEALERRRILFFLPSAAPFLLAWPPAAQDQYQMNYPS